MLELDVARVMFPTSGTLVDIVGTMANNRGWTCPHHYCCGMQVGVTLQVAFWHEQLVFRDVHKGMSFMTCKVGFCLRI